MSNNIKSNNVELLINDKFKDVHFSIRFMSENKEPEVTIRNLLAYLMIDRNERYPTKQSINLKTDDLFALSFDVKTSSYGKIHVLEMKFTTLSERYSKEAHLEEALAFIECCIRTPLINEETLLEAKQNMRSNLLRIYDKPSTLAALSALSLAGKDEPISVFSLGKIEIMEKITVEDLKTYHQKMLINDDVYVIGIGQIDPRYYEILKSIYTKTKSLPCASYCVSDKKYQEKKIFRKVKQTSLVSLYTFGKNNTTPDYMSYRVLSYLLGTLPNSLLFTEIREKRNLCYSIYSNLMHYDGILSIHTGISKKQRNLVLELIDEQIEVIKNDKFSDSLFNSAKSLLKNNYSAIEDDVSSWINITFSAWLLDKTYDHKKIVDEIDRVDRKSIVNAAKSLKKLCTFTVTGQE
jgi:predicted Zn-dependent peptidase